MVTPRSQRLTISKLVPTCSAKSAWDQPLRLRARRKRSLGTNSSELFIDSPLSISTPRVDRLQPHPRNPVGTWIEQDRASSQLLPKHEVDCLQPAVRPYVTAIHFQ